MNQTKNLNAHAKQKMFKYTNPDSVFKRKTVTAYGMIFPITAILLTISLTTYSIFLYIKYLGNPFSASNIKVFFIVLAAPLPIILFIPVYLFFLNLFRNAIMKLFWADLILSCLVIIIPGLISGNLILSLICCLIPIAFTALYLCCFWRQIKLAALTIRSCLVQIGQVKLKVFSSLFFITLILSLLVTACSFSALLSLSVLKKEKDSSTLNTENSDTTGNPKDSDSDKKTAGTSNTQSSPGEQKKLKWVYVTDTEAKILSLLLSLADIALLYFTEFVSAVAFIYGAAFYNQSSLKKHDMVHRNIKDNINFSEVCSEAGHIALRSSIGVAAVGSFIVTLASLIESYTEENVKKERTEGETSLGSLILLCLAKIFKEIALFLTAQAYVYTALYGEGLFKSAKMSFDSFKTAGLKKYFNYTFSGGLLSIMATFFAFSIGVMVGFLTYLLGKGLGVDGETTGVSIILAIVISIIVMIILLIPIKIVNNIVGGHSAAQIAVQVEDPDRSMQTHPEAEKFVKLIKN